MNMQFLRSVELLPDAARKNDVYPFSLNAIRHLDKLEFHPNVTFFVGENGSGKSTLMEAIAVKYGLNPEGGSRNFNFATEESHSVLHNAIRLAKGLPSRDSYFLRAESYYNVASHIDELDRIPASARPIRESYGGKSLHQQSHGESFFSLFKHRFGGKGLYFLDEPEAALSPQRQIEFLSRLNELVEAGSQFVIATHSPILLSYPKSRLYLLTKDGYSDVHYRDTDHFKVYKEFLDNPDEALNTLGIR